VAQLKDTDKVTTRNKWDFVSVQRPDRKSERMRTQQRHEHGWRAPLNRSYAQLGSSSSDPLSRTHSVHTSLSKYPQQAQREVDLQQKNNRTIELELGVPCQAAVPKFGLVRFVLTHEDPRGHLIIALANKNGGDADVFVSVGDELPTQLQYNWASAGMGNDKIEIRPDDNAFRDSHHTVVGTFNVAVYGGGGLSAECAFTLTASSYRPVGGSHAKVRARCRFRAPCSPHARRAPRPRTPAARPPHAAARPPHARRRTPAARAGRLTHVRRAVCCTRCTTRTATWRPSRTSAASHASGSRARCVASA
jgi:hypothetical protein